MRVDNDSHPAETHSPKRSFKDELQKKLTSAKGKPAAKPQPPKAGAKPLPGQSSLGKLANSKPGMNAGAAQPLLDHAQTIATLAKSHARLQSAQNDFDSTLARGEKATSKFEDTLVNRRSETELHQPEIRQMASQIARLLTEPPPQKPKQKAEPDLEAISSANASSNLVSQANPQAARQPAAPPPRAEALVGQIEKLIERAELLSKAEGPSLQIGLSEGRASSIEVVRTGKGEVALRLTARTGSERRALAGQLDEIKHVLAQRGLKVRDVRVS